ncbi:GNAT family N-acetyltransferase [Deinococcus roseus]|uniref:N-acetyltransferase domain-containing protein n=1 Tax=Deinococcus roseus TaxID=392414 RepID=A0ABQ2CWF1_9DEIO|nr:GNAT family N-acetyltransferase [Deinococcus roseus]GGJ27688.1 hypothetical protein GCM10008938_12220 [Deinococcus roseus]
MLRPLTAQDQSVVQNWLEVYIRQHIAYWEEAYQTAAQSNPAEVATQQWQDLLKASEDPQQFVRVYGEKPLGIIQGAIRQDPYLGVPLGQLSWLYVDAESRGLGVPDPLIASLLEWFAEKEVAGRVVYVTAANAAAVRVYERNGFRTIDYRMLGPAVQK